MKVILEFDNGKIDEYYTTESFDKRLRRGGVGRVSFCHPNEGPMVNIAIYGSVKGWQKSLGDSRLRSWWRLFLKRNLFFDYS